MSTGRWYTPAEDAAILDAQAARLTMVEAGALIGRSWESVASRVRFLGYSWGQGWTSTRQVAQDCGCSLEYASEVAWRLFGHGVTNNVHGSGRRFRLTDEQADALRAALRPGRFAGEA